MAPRKQARPQGRQGRQQWIDFLRYSLADICVRGEWDDFGIFRILNRVSFLSCNQLAFIIYHVGSGSRIVDKEISTFDPLFQDALFGRLKGLGLAVADGDSGDLVVDKVAAAPYEIQLFDTHNRIILFELDVTDVEPPGAQPILEFVPVLAESELGLFYQEVFEPFDGRNGRMYLADRIEDHIAGLRAAGAYETATRDQPEDYPPDAADLDLVNTFAATVCELASAEYNRLSKSPVLRSFLAGRNGCAEGLSNFFMMSKIFSRQSTRYFKYHYDPVLMAGNRQLDALAEGLQVVERDELIPFGIKRYDDAFWRRVGSREGISEIINDVRGGWPQHVRLFAENALMSGSSMIKPDIFRRSGLVWIAGDGLTRAERDEAYRRANSLHYVLQLGSPVVPTEADELSVMSVPFRCSGGIWMCANFLRENVSRDHPDEPPEVEGLLSQSQFHISYSIYHAQLREAERRLRTKARTAYIEALATLVSEAARETFERGGGAGVMLDHEALDAFNHRSSVLARVYPFQHITLLHARDGRPVRFDGLKLRAEPNPFFDRLTLHDFLNEEGTAQRLRERIALNVVMESIKNSTQETE